MSGRRGLGFGGFLVGLGAGWMMFQEIIVSADLFAWILILAGAAVVASSLRSRSPGTRRYGGLFNGLVGGLILALLISTNFVLFGISSSAISGNYRA